MSEDKIIYRQSFNGDPLQLQLWPKRTASQVGQFAMDLVRSWGLVVGKNYGEDSAGRAVMATMPIEEVVCRAFDIAEATFAEMDKRSMLIDVLDPEAARQLCREERGRN